jgi:hypothetical protein
MRIHPLLAAGAVYSMTVLAPVPPASAATLTFTDSSCADFTIANNGNGNFTVTCNFIAVPMCQLSVSNSSPVVGSTITLSAGCSATPFNWFFAGTSSACSTFSSTCSETRSTPGSVTYSVLGQNGAGRGPLASVTVNWQPAAPVASPSGCTLAANPGSLSAGGGAVTLTASCVGGGAPMNFAWSGGSVAASTTVGAQATNITATTSFSVTPSNGGGAGNTATAVVSVAGTSTPPPSLDFCTQYPNVVVLDVPWGGQAVSGGAGAGFQANGVLVARFTVPAGFTSNSGKKGKVTHAEYGDPPTYRQASLSTKACDFRGAATTASTPYQFSLAGGGVNFPMYWTFSNTGYIEFTVTGTAFNTTQLQAGQTYYYNVRNYSPDLQTNSCGSGATCNAIVSISTPL